MKVIGKTERQYLVEMTGDEIAQTAGYRSDYSEAFQRAVSWKNGGIPIGAKIVVTAAHAYLEKLRESETATKNAAKTLQMLADMITSAVPTTLIPPDAPAKDPAE